jgi:excisionase family DNA binding protein
MPVTCSICDGDIRDDGDDGEVGWSESAFCTADGSRYIHYECQYAAALRDAQYAAALRDASASPAPTAAAITNTPGQPHNPSDYLTLPAADYLTLPAADYLTLPAADYLTLPAAAQLLGISAQTLRLRIKTGTLAAFRLAGGQTILIERAALLALLEPL